MSPTKLLTAQRSVGQWIRGIPGTCRTSPDRASGSRDRFEPLEIRWVRLFSPENQPPARSGNAPLSSRSSRSITAGAQYTDSISRSSTAAAPLVDRANSLRSSLIAEPA